jgi:antitoxin VapB
LAHPDMTISIKDPAIDKAARELAELTGESVTEAVGKAVTERLQRFAPRRIERPLAAELDDIARRCASLPVRDDRSPDEILGYGENGVPH